MRASGRCHQGGAVTQVGFKIAVMSARAAMATVATELKPTALTMRKEEKRDSQTQKALKSMVGAEFSDGED